jgi:hypothetical protein
LEGSPDRSPARDTASGDDGTRAVGSGDAGVNGKAWMATLQGMLLELLAEAAEIEVLE